MLQLYRGIDLDGNTVGLANVRAMCSSTNSFGLTEDKGRSLESTGAIAAHELGHIFNMQHDDSPSEWKALSCHYDYICMVIIIHSMCIVQDLVLVLTPLVTV